MSNTIDISDATVYLIGMETNDINRIFERNAKRAEGQWLIEAGISRLCEARRLEDSVLPPCTALDSARKRHRARTLGGASLAADPKAPYGTKT